MMDNKKQRLTLDTSLIQRLNRNRKYHGKCIGLINDNVIVYDKSISTVIRKLSAPKYKGQKKSLFTLPKKSKILHLHS